MPASLQLEHVVATLSCGEELRIPYWHIRSGRGGPQFLVLAAQHGNEVNGCEASRRFGRVAADALVRGDVYIVPFGNLLALRHRRSHISLKAEQPYAEDGGHNMNRTWPGDADGNDTERVSFALHQTIVEHCTHVLDFHAWSRFSATGAILRRGYEPSEALGRVSAIRFIHPGTVKKGPRGHTTLGGLLNDTARAGITIELAPQWAVVEREVRRGLRAATNIAKQLGMMEGEPEGTDAPQFYLDEVAVVEVRAEHEGLFVEASVATWDYVEVGQRLGHIMLPDTLEVVEIAVPVAGYLLRFGAHRRHSDVALPAMHPYADEGDLLAAIVAAEP